jgi:hypothetical protein
MRRRFSNQGSDMSERDESEVTEWPALLLDRLDQLGAQLARNGDAIALLGLGSVGADRHRLDDHSDLDFFVVVDDGAKQRYLDSIDWLEALHPVMFDVPNTRDGRKVLFADEVYAEYAVFTVAELPRIAFAPGRIIWSRADAPAGLEVPQTRPRLPDATDLDVHVGEALTNLFVGLHRDARGERLSAMRLIQVFAVDQVLTIAELTDPGAPPRQDAFGIERSADQRFDPTDLPLAAMVPGYEHNRAAASVMLDWLVARVDVPPAMASAIRRLCDPSTSGPTAGFAAGP